MNFWKIINLITLAGLLVLGFLFFTRSGNSPVSASSERADVPDDARIVFVNSDTLRKHYDLVKDMNAELEAQFASRENDIASKQQRYEKDAAYFQQQVKAGTISEQSAQSIYEDLMRNQQALLDLRDKYTGELQEREYLMNERFVDSVYNYLERYNQQYGFDYILGYNRGSGILFATDTLDITQDVINGMNEEYRINKEKAPVK